PESSSNSTTATSAAFNRNSREPPVPSFSGENEHGMSADFSSWLPQFEDCAAMFEYTDQAKTFWLKQKLSHSAASFIHSQSEELKSSYPLMIEALTNYFKDTTSVTMRYKELFACKQAPNDSITVFGEHLSELLRRAERLEVFSSDVAKKHLFITGVHDRYKADLLAKMEDTTTFEQLCELARNLERQKQEIKEFKNGAALPSQQSQSQNTHRQFNNNNNRFNQQKFPYQQRPSQKSTAGSFSMNTKKVCFYCGEAHFSAHCAKFPTLEQRKRKAFHHCFNCLSDNHMVRQCPNQKGCMNLQQRHHTSLCHQSFPTRSNTPVYQAASSSTPPVAIDSNRPMVSEPEVALLAPNETGLLQTAVTEISNIGDSNKKMEARLLFDTGSQRSFITQCTADQLSLEPFHYETLSVASFGSSRNKPISSAAVHINVKQRDGSFKMISANVVSLITRPIERGALKLDTFPKSLFLADPIHYTAGRLVVDILIGTDHYYDFVSFERQSISPSLFLLKSTLGWIPTGKYETETSKNESASLLLHNNISPVFCEPEIKQFWSLESIGIADSPYSVDDDVALQLFNRSIQFHDNRYFVTWPWKEEYPALLSNYEKAFIRLRYLMKTFSSNPTVLEKYGETIDNQLKMGIIEKVTPEMAEGPLIHYIPHHCVIRPDKATTKLHIVYDAS
ncbi:MAG: hypothetical protein GY816_20085, partial [Cytophagales bacterium]|nr:hypothetical protein [Cytophagales bacterium]